MRIMSNTLPEITIEGSPESEPNAGYWWGEGFARGFNTPDMSPDPPPLNDLLAAYFRDGVESGQNKRREMDAEIDGATSGSHQLVPWIEGGEPYEEVQRRYE